MSNWTKFNSFVEALAEKTHNLGSDTLKVALTNTAPAASNTILSNITQISAAGGYAPVTVTISVSAQSGGTYTLSHNAFAFTATGAAYDQFRYAVLFNDTATNDELIAWWDYGVGHTLASGSTFTFNAGNILTLA